MSIKSIPSIPAFERKDWVTVIYSLIVYWKIMSYVVQTAYDFRWFWGSLFLNSNKVNLLSSGSDSICRTLRALLRWKNFHERLDERPPSLRALVCLFNDLDDAVNSWSLLFFLFLCSIERLLCSCFRHSRRMFAWIDWETETFFSSSSDNSHELERSLWTKSFFRESRQKAKDRAATTLLSAFSRFEEWLSDTAVPILTHFCAIHLRFRLIDFSYPPLLRASSSLFSLFDV